MISTISDLVADINFKAWYSILGVAGGFELAQDLDQALPDGKYYNGGPFTPGDLSNPASAYVDDNAFGDAFRNYAFAVDHGPAPIPLPAAGWLMLAGLGGLVVLRRRKAA